MPGSPQAAATAACASARLDELRAEGVVEMTEGLLLGHPGQGDELVGVERRASHGHPLEDLAGSRPQPGEHAGLEGRRPVLPGGGAGGGGPAG